MHDPGDWHGPQGIRISRTHCPHTHCIAPFSFLNYVLGPAICHGATSAGVPA